jgi:hypothetical protein
MTQTTDAQRSLNRLRAAAGLIPIIEAGLNDGKLANERAALMCEFCTWAAGHGDDLGDEGKKLTSTVVAGLSRLKLVLAS